MSGIKFASGRMRPVGRAFKYTTPVALDPDAYHGAIVAGEDDLVHYSTGDRWIAVAPVLSTLIDAGNAETDYTGGAKIDLGSAQT